MGIQQIKLTRDQLLFIHEAIEDAATECEYSEDISQKAIDKLYAASEIVDGVLSYSKESLE